MRVQASHLTYCTNVHPGETLSEVRRMLEGPLLEVRAQVCPDQPFGIGLRLSAQAAQELQSPTALDDLRRWLLEHNLYVFTLNGFPYGTFHARPVKEAVYLPDWRQGERSEYTHALINILTELLPEGVPGSISTVPGGFKPHLTAADSALIAERLLAQVAQLHHVSRARGVEIALALEPEPHCLFETTTEVVRFYEEQLVSEAALGNLQRQLQLPSLEHAESIVRKHLGVCLDTCHAAVEFERADESIQLLVRAGIPLSKIQLSAGLCLNPQDPHQLGALAAFDEPVYLHQVVSRLPSGQLLRFSDLPEALGSRDALRADEWRVHFHVPIYRDALTHFTNTQAYLARILELHRAQALSPHLEVETYTWDVLPADERKLSVVDSIAREIRWAAQRLTL